MLCLQPEGVGRLAGGSLALTDHLPLALQLAVEALEQEKRGLQTQIAQVLEGRQQLAHLKMSLSLEVATYRYRLARPTCARRHTHRGKGSSAQGIGLGQSLPHWDVSPLEPACSPVGPGPEKCSVPRKSPGGGEAMEWDRLRDRLET